MDELSNVGDELDLTVRRGSTFGPMTVALQNTDGTPMDLSGCRLEGQVRRLPLDTAVVADFDFDLSQLLQGTFSFGLAKTALLSATVGNTIGSYLSEYRYDIVLIDSLERVIPLLQGKFTILREVTRTPALLPQYPVDSTGALLVTASGALVFF